MAKPGPFLLLAPITGALVSAVLVGERLDAVQLAGGALIVGAIALATLTRRPAARSMPA